MREKMEDKRKMEQEVRDEELRSGEGDEGNDGREGKRRKGGH